MRFKHSRRAATALVGIALTGMGVAVGCAPGWKTRETGVKEKAICQ